MALQFAKDGYSNILAAIILSVTFCVIGFIIDHWIAYVLYCTAALLMAFILFFFRDPDRDIPAGKDLLLSPADGKIVFLKEVDEPEYIKGKALQISIFLSPLDVHVNRLPASGKIEYVKYNPGVYLMAWDHRASSMNERADFGILHPSGIRVFFRQITGFMARRIVYHLKEGDQVQAGKRFGMMKFGSRMDILVPAEVKVEVKKGDRTVAGETILAKINAG
ncbi:MAG: phosphatidylserine decarboxylase family protein [Balneolaceae bacterium]|nr:phosphatidylserine decarboxylase family protein [Balneolaceae bacterium]